MIHELFVNKPQSQLKRQWRQPSAIPFMAPQTAPSHCLTVFKMSLDGPLMPNHELFPTLCTLTPPPEWAVMAAPLQRVQPQLRQADVGGHKRPFGVESPANLHNQTLVRLRRVYRLVARCCRVFSGSASSPLVWRMWRDWANGVKLLPQPALGNDDRQL